jgi:nicotinate-nucleotide adenylyltransferase
MEPNERVSSPSLEEIIQRVSRHVHTALRGKRLGHSVRVAATAERLCGIFGLNPRIGFLAGLAHDMCKELDPGEITRLAALDGAPILAAEREKPSLLHGRAAAIQLARDFGVVDGEVREAVREHTYGKAGMCGLAKVLYIADKIEPGREYCTPEYLARLEGLPLDGMLMAVLRDNLKQLEKKQKPIVDSSYELLAFLENESRGVRKL